MLRLRRICLSARVRTDLHRRRLLRQRDLWSDQLIRLPEASLSLDAYSDMLLTVLHPDVVHAHVARPSPQHAEAVHPVQQARANERRSPQQPLELNPQCA